MKKDQGGTVFPLMGGNYNSAAGGLTLRDLIAIAWLLKAEIPTDAKTRSEDAYEIADAMMEARIK